MTGCEPNRLTTFCRTTLAMSVSSSSCSEAGLRRYARPPVSIFRVIGADRQRNRRFRLRRVKQCGDEFERAPGVAKGDGQGTSGLQRAVQLPHQSFEPRWYMRPVLKSLVDPLLDLLR